MGQYFENDTNLASNITTISYTYLGHLLTYKVDLGVFSKTRVDFGTNTLLQALPRLDNINSILDVGCGYGPIGLAIAKAYKNTTVDMIDVNNRAIDLSINNANDNKIYNTNIFISDTYEKITKEYDLIVTNPPIRAGKKVVYDIVLNASLHLKENGKIILVIQKKHGGVSLKETMKDTYDNVEVIAKDNGYLVISATKKA